MKPTIILLVHSRSGAATLLAQVGRRRAADLGLKAEIVPQRGNDPLAATDHAEGVTAVVPVDFAATQHEAWCLLCRLSLMRREVSFSILVLGAAGSAEFQVRQRALLHASAARRRRAA